MRSVAVFIALWVPWLSACASTSWQGAWRAAEKVGEPTIDRAELRLLSAADPDGAAADAEAILGAPPGTYDRRTLTRAFHVLLVASDITGAFERPVRWLPPFVAAPLDLESAEIAIPQLDRCWGRLDGVAPDDAAVVGALEAALTDAWAPDLAAARLELVRHRLQVQRLGKTPVVAESPANPTFLTDWRLSGPWGRAPLLDFREFLGPERQPLKTHEETGAGWAQQKTPTRRGVFSGGEVTFFELADAPGVAFAETTLPPTVAGAVVISLETNRLAIVHIDGVPVVGRTDLRTANHAAAVVQVPPNRQPQRVTVKFATADGRGFFRVGIASLPATVPASVSPAERVALSLGPANPDAVVRAFLHLQRLVARPWRDLRAARQLLDRLETVVGDGAIVRFFRYRLDFLDADLGQGGRREALRRHLDFLQQQWPDNAALRRELARIEREELRFDAAMKLLQTDGADPRSRLELLDMQRQRGWEAEALANMRALVQQYGESPRMLQEGIDTLLAFGRAAEARVLAEKLAARFPVLGAGRLAAQHLDAGDSAAAAELYLKLFEAEPQNHGHLRNAVHALRLAGQLERAGALLRAFLADRPGDVWALGELARLATGCMLKQQSGAVATPRESNTCEPHLALVDAVLEAEPVFQPMLSLARFLRGEGEPLDDAPADALPLLVAARGGLLANEGPLGSHPVVTVLDRGHVIVRTDGSSLELRHRIRQANTRSGADALGDIRVPAGARLLVARTIKADGRVVYPEVTPGKTDLSLSELQPGDAVETAWVVRSRTRPEEGGYLTSLGFAQVGVPTIEVQHDIIVPPNFRLEVTAHNGAPSPRVDTLPDGASRWRWSVRPPMPAIIPREALAAGARAFVPFSDIRLASAKSDPRREREEALLEVSRAFANRIDALSPLGVRGEALLDTLTKAAGGGADGLVEEALAWVRKNVEATETLNQFDTPVERAISAGRGNRALVLHGLLAHRDPTVSLILCAPRMDGPAPDEAAPVPNANRFFYPLVRVRQRLIDPARLHTPGADLADELRGAACLEPAASVRRTLSVATIPATPRDAPAFDIEITAHVGATGDARMTLIGRFGGPAAAGLRQVWLAQDDTRRRMLWEQWLGGLFIGARLESAEVRDAAHAEKPMEVKLVFTVPGWARAEDGLLVVAKIAEKQVLAGDFTSTPDLQDLVGLPARQTPLRIPAHSERLRLHIRPPDGWRLQPRSDLDDPAPTITSYPTDSPLLVTADRNATKDGVWLVERVIRTFPGRIAPGTEYANFRNAISDTIATRLVPIRIEPAR